MFDHHTATLTGLIYQTDNKKGKTLGLHYLSRLLEISGFIERLASTDKFLPKAKYLTACWFADWDWLADAIIALDTHDPLAFATDDTLRTAYDYLTRGNTTSLYHEANHEAAFLIALWEGNPREWEYVTQWSSHTTVWKHKTTERIISCRLIEGQWKLDR